MARELLHGNAFAGQHGFIDAAGAGDHFAVGGDALARLYQDDVAGAQPFDGRAGFQAVYQDARGLRLQLHQTSQGGGGLALGPDFQGVAR